MERPTLVKDTAVLKGLAQLHHEKPPPPAPCMAGDNAPAAPVMVQRGSLTPIEAVCTVHLSTGHQYGA